MHACMHGMAWHGMAFSQVACAHPHLVATFASQARLLPAGFLPRLAPLRAFRAALAAAPPALRQKVLARAEAEHGPLRLDALARVEEWLRRAPAAWPRTVARPRRLEEPERA